MIGWLLPRSLSVAAALASCDPMGRSKSRNQNNNRIVRKEDDTKGCTRMKIINLLSSTT
jgi:hypothetical protein